MEEAADRYMYDVLDYYDLDINWTSYSTVPALMMAIFWWRLSGRVGAQASAGASNLLQTLIAQRVLQFILLSPFRS